MSQRKNQISVGIILSYLQYLVSAIIGIGYVPVLINKLSTSEYGIYQLMGSFMAFLTVLDLGMSGTVTRYYAKYDSSGTEEAKENFLAIARNVYIAIGTATLILGSVFYFFIDNIYNKGLSIAELQQVKQIYLLLLLNAVFVIWSNFYSSILQAIERFLAVKLLLLLRTLILPIITILVISIEPRVYWIYFIQLCMSFVLLLSYYLCGRYRYHIRIKYHGFDIQIIRELFSYSFLMLLNIVVDELYWSTDSMILGAVKGTVEVAVYGTASLIVSQYRAFASVIHGIFLPRLTKIMDCQDNDHNMLVNRIFISISKIQFFIASLILTGFIIFGQEFVRIWAGNGYEDVYILALVPMAALLIPLSQSICLSILRACNKQKFRAYLYVALAVLNVGLSIPMCHILGGLGCVLVTALFLVFGNVVIMNIYYSKAIKLDIRKFYVSVIAKSGAISITLLLWGMFINFRFCITERIGVLIIKIFIYTIIYTLIFYKTLITQEDKSILIGRI